MRWVNLRFCCVIAVMLMMRIKNSDICLMPR